MSKLPAELCQLVLDFLLEDAFYRGRVYPSSAPMAGNILRALNKQLYSKYSQQYWSENVWVIGNGDANTSMRFMTLCQQQGYSTEFSRQIPNPAVWRIRHLELSFSKNDLRCPYENARAGLQDTSRKVAPVEVPQAHANSCSRSLMEVWRDKLDRVALLDLKSLKLDLTEAYGPHQSEFMGFFAIQRLMPFVYGLPTDFQISAPTRAMERRIRREFSITGQVP